MVGIDLEYLHPLAVEVIRDTTIGKAVDDSGVKAFFLSVDGNARIPTEGGVITLAEVLSLRLKVLLEEQGFMEISDLGKIDAVQLLREPLVRALFTKFKNKVELDRYLQSPQA